MLVDEQRVFCSTPRCIRNLHNSSSTIFIFSLTLKIRWTLQVVTMKSPQVLDLDLPELSLIAQGKVRNLYETDKTTLLFVATDRISAFDVVMRNGIPNKGALLNLLSSFWFDFLSKAIPGLKTHFITLDIPKSLSQSLPPDRLAQLYQRSMQVQKLEVFPIEAIVRGYITGSAWVEYQAHGTVHGMKVPAGLQESEEFPGGAIYTPSTKAEAGKHDENIHPDQAKMIIGEKYAKRIQDLAIEIYTKAREHAAHCGIIIADTKLEFGLDANDEVILIDEVLTPDSSRFWPAASYEIGRSQQSFDKQHLRDYLISNCLKGKQGVRVPDDIVRDTAERYQEAFEVLTGKVWASVA